jgi:electron transfer flavoprotein beta subunit
MNAVVLLRAVPDREALIEPRPLIVDGPSLVALGLARSSQRVLGGGDFRGISVGPAEWEPALREALALDLDGLVRIEAGPDADIVATARALVASIPAGTSFVFTGSSATDHGSGLLSAALAEALGWPLIGSVTGVELHDGLPAVRVRGDAGARRLLRLPIPAVLEAASGAVPSLYPRLAKKLAARKAMIPVVERTADVQRLRIDGYGPARPVTRTLFRPSASARPAERMRQLMSGGMAKRAGQTIAAESGVAQQLADVIEGQGFISQAE